MGERWNGRSSGHSISLQGMRGRGGGGSLRGAERSGAEGICGERGRERMGGRAMGRWAVIAPFLVMIACVIFLVCVLSLSFVSLLCARYDVILLEQVEIVLRFFIGMERNGKYVDDMKVLRAILSLSLMKVLRAMKATTKQSLTISLNG